MNYQNIDFHNVEFIELNPEKDKLNLCRVNEYELSLLNEKAQITAFNTCALSFALK